MAEYHIGTVRQASFATGSLLWKSPEKTCDNDIRRSSILEIDATLSTENFHICVPYDGTETYRVDGQFIPLQIGQYFILQPGQTARGEGNFGKEVQGLCFFLTKKILSEVAAGMNTILENSLENSGFNSWTEQEFVSKIYYFHENIFGQYLKNLLPKLMQSGDGIIADETGFYYDLAEALLDGHRQINRQLNAIPYSKTMTRHEIYRRISLVRHHILDNFSEPVILEDLEKVALFSKYHIVRLYRNIYGVTPYQHLLQLRIEKAKILLSRNYSPTEVAYQLSFSDRRAFRKIFKKFTGMTPSDFILNS